MHALDRIADALERIANSLERERTYTSVGLQPIDPNSMRGKIIRFLASTDTPLTGREVAQGIGKGSTNISPYLLRMKDQGLLDHQRHCYSLTALGRDMVPK